MYVSSTVLDLEPRQVSAAVGLVRDRVLPVLATLEGSRGATMMANRATGRTITSTLWGTRGAMEAGAAPLGPFRAQAHELLGGAALVEEWEVAELFREHHYTAGFATRSTRIEFQPRDAQQLVDVVRTTMVPALAMIDGFASAALLIDIDRGSGVTLVTFTDRQSLEDSRRAAAEIRRTTVEKAHAQATEVVEADVLVAEIRLPDQA